MGRGSSQCCRQSELPIKNEGGGGGGGGAEPDMEWEQGRITAGLECQHDSGDKRDGGG